MNAELTNQEKQILRAIEITTPYVFEDVAKVYLTTGSIDKTLKILDAGVSSGLSIIDICKAVEDYGSGRAVVLKGASVGMSTQVRSFVRMEGSELLNEDEKHWKLTRMLNNARTFCDRHGVHFKAIFYKYKDV